VVRAAAPAEARRLLQKFSGGKGPEEKLLRLPADVRARLRAACAEVNWPPPRPLLAPAGLGELEPLLTGPPAQSGATAFAVLAKDEAGLLLHVPPADRARMRRRARDFLLSAPAAAAAYVKAAREYSDADPQLLGALFTPFSAEAAALLDRLLAGAALEPADWRQLCAAAGLMKDRWGEYLLEGERLASLLVNLGGDGAGRDIWDVYLGLLTPALVSPDLDGGDNWEEVHRWERKVHANLRAAAERLTRSGVKLADALPDGGVRRLFAASGLVKWAEDPAGAEADGHDEVQHACALFEVDPVRLVAAAYKAGGFGEYSPADAPDALAPVVSLFRTCFPVDGSFNTARRAAAEAVRLSQEAPGPFRGQLQALLIESCVPDVHYQSLLSADWREPLDPHVVAHLSAALQRGAKKGAPKYAPPAREAAAVPVAEAPFGGEGGESPEPEPVIQKKRGKGRPARAARARRGAKRGNGLAVVLIVALLAAAAGGVYVAVKSLGGQKPAPATKQK
jgi:hypothetical protein